jgi:hypothetical protein
MKSKFDFAIAASVVCMAGYAAIALTCTAYYLGLSPLEIRTTAVSVAVILALLIAIDFFGKRLGKAK